MSFLRANSFLTHCKQISGRMEPTAGQFESFFAQHEICLPLAVINPIDQGLSTRRVNRRLRRLTSANDDEHLCRRVDTYGNQLGMSWLVNE